MKPQAAATALWIMMMMMPMSWRGILRLSRCRQRQQPFLLSSVMAWQPQPSRPRPARSLSLLSSSSAASTSSFLTLSSSPSSRPSRAATATKTTTTTALFSSTKQEEETATASESTTAAAAPSTNVELIGLEWVQDAVVNVLNELYDPQQVAAGKAAAQFQAKLKKKKNKKKKKKQQPAEESSSQQEQEDAKLLAEQQQAAVNAAVAAAAGKPFDRSAAMVTPATRADFGDYQINAAMGLAQALQRNPRDVAAEIVQALQQLPLVQDYLETPLEIAGPGFINLRFSNTYLTTAATAMARDAAGRLALPTVGTDKSNSKPKLKICVDFSSPNIAKEMHVGHLRSTIIGDTLCNVLELAGHTVVRLNHVGDWGTQFGMLVEHLRDEYPAALDANAAESVDLGDLVVLYKAAKKRFDDEDAFKTRAREGVVKLQAGQAAELAAWETLCQASRVEFEKIYDILHIAGLQERGESFYNPYLADVVTELQEQGLAVESNGASVVFLDGYTNRDGSPLPMIVQKSDGGYNYATTDLAAIRHRTLLENGEQADRVLYVTDAGQAQHFAMVFAAAQKAQFCPPTCTLEHVPFGLVQGEDGKKFATRSGDTVKLKDLLDEAVRIAEQDLVSRNPHATPEELQRLQDVARVVGIGAVKYADLSLNRESNYRFSYNRMLSLNGNTAPYMLYAFARIGGIIRKATNQPDSNTFEWPAVDAEILITHDAERELIRNLVKLPDVLQEVERDLYPSRICDYLFETSKLFNQFYENCSVNQAETAELKASRLSLCAATAGTIRLLMNLLGISVVEKL